MTTALRDFDGPISFHHLQHPNTPTPYHTKNKTQNPQRSYFLNAMTVPDKAHHMVHSRTYHSKVLKKAPGNVYAAHGLGLVLAEEFGKVRRAAGLLAGWPVPCLPPCRLNNPTTHLPSRVPTNQPTTAQRHPTMNKQVEDARAVLQSIRERSGDKPDEILVNIAHLFTAQVRGRWLVEWSEGGGEG